MALNDGRVVSNFILQALQGKEITVYGDGSQTRSFCYVDDLIDGMIRMMNTTDLTGPINLGNPVEFSVSELAEKVIALIGSRSKIAYKALPQDDPTQRKPDITLASQKLFWFPKTGLEEGLKKTITYFEKMVANAGDSRPAIENALGS
jgi:UDP-glucuronate decarboxylase